MNTNIYGIENRFVTKEDIEDHIAVAMVVRHPKIENKIAIFFHRKYQFYTIPVGKCKDIVNLIPGMKKEAEEELGIIVTKFKIIGSFRKLYNRGHDIFTDITSYIFEFESYENEPKNKESEKHPSFMWMTIEEIEELSKDSRISDCTLFYLYLMKVLNRE